MAASFVCSTCTLITSDIAAGCPLLEDNQKSALIDVISVFDPTRTSTGKYMLDRSIAFRASSLPLHCGGLIHGAFGMERREFIALVGGGTRRRAFRTWAKMEPLCLGKPGDPGRSGKDNRLFVEAVLWIARTGSPGGICRPSFGHWNSVFTRFRDWVKADVWKRLFDAVSDDPDMEYAMVDATIVKVHRHGQGAKGGLKARPSAVRKAA